MELDYLQAAFPERFRLLGRPLRPFSLGHLHLLRWLGNAYVQADGKPGPGDLIQGVFVCSRSYEDALAALEAPGLQLRLRLWGWSCGKRFSMSEKMRVFGRYIEEGSQPPDLHENDGDGRHPGAPLIQRVRVRLMTQFGMSYSAAMNYPWRLALHDYFAGYEMEERAKLLNKDEAETVDEHEKLWAQLDIAQIGEAVAQLTPQSELRTPH